MPGIYNGFTGSQRMTAYRWLMGEYAAGRRTWPVKCDACGQTEGVIEPHDEDYSPPYGDHIGRWGLCYRCHMVFHCRFRNPEMFRRYCAVLAGGNRFAALHTRNFPAVLGQHRLPNSKAPIEHVGTMALPGFQPLIDEGRAVIARRTGQGDLF
jgi:hypothetical protein